MIKTICDICGNDMPLEMIRSIKDYNFCISSHERVWDIAVSAGMNLISG